MVMHATARYTIMATQPPSNHIGFKQHPRLMYSRVSGQCFLVICSLSCLSLIYVTLH